jgi:hypothetical protein
MKVALTLTHEEIITALREHLKEQVGHLDVGEVKLYVKSKENYRLKTYELAATLIMNEVAAEDPQVKSSLKTNDEKPELKLEGTAS